MLTEKKMVSLEDIEAQEVLELPDRQMMATQRGLVNVDIDLTNVDVLSNNNVNLQVLTANSPVRF